MGDVAMAGEFTLNPAEEISLISGTIKDASWMELLVHRPQIWIDCLSENWKPFKGCRGNFERVNSELRWAILKKKITCNTGKILLLFLFAVLQWTNPAYAFKSFSSGEFYHKTITHQGLKGISTEVGSANPQKKHCVFGFRHPGCAKSRQTGCRGRPLYFSRK